MSERPVLGNMVKLARPQRFTASSKKRTKNLTSFKHLSSFSLNQDYSPRKGDLYPGHRADH